MKGKQYDKIDLLNKRIQDQLEILQKGQSIEKQRLIADLEKRKSDLLTLEDQQRAFEIELNNKNNSVRRHVNRTPKKRTKS